MILKHLYEAYIETKLYRMAPHLILGYQGIGRNTDKSLF